MHDAFNRLELSREFIEGALWGEVGVFAWGIGSFGYGGE
jgi:hypothetical protein